MTERTILAIKLYPKTQPGLGLIEPIAEEIDGKLIPITEENFCQTKQVFIAGRYEEIEQRFRDNEIFRIPVTNAYAQYENSPIAQCKYKAYGQYATSIIPSDIAQIIDQELPDRNNKILSSNDIPSTPYIFIKNARGECYGPFDWEELLSTSTSQELNSEHDVKLKFITGAGLGQAGRTKQIIKLNEGTLAANITYCKYNKAPIMLIKNISNVLSQAAFIDYASDKEIIEFVRVIASETAGRHIDKRALANLARMASNSGKANTSLAKSRIALFTKIVEDESFIQVEMDDFFDNYLKGDFGVKIIDEYIQRNRVRYIDQLKQEKEIEIDEKIIRKNEELKIAEEKSLRIRKELQDVAAKLDEEQRKLEQGIVADQKAYLEKVSAETSASIEQLNNKIIDKQNKLDELTSKYGQLERIEDVENKITEKKGVLGYIQEQLTTCEGQLQHTRELCSKGDEELSKRLRDLKPFMDHINGGGINYKNEQQVDISTNIKMMQSNKDLLSAQRDIIDSVRYNFLSKGRNLADWQIANILISTQQSFITFLAGLPGVGKTSLCKFLASAQDIQQRQHIISVARGWTAIKDIIGFHNPLTDRFQPANTGLYYFLKSLDDEVKQVSQDSAMAYILLDEANLSPIEHYWSNFMALSDEYQNKQIRIGEENIIIPNYLRFMATINYDGTTEPLSPRILDRASVIVISPEDFSEPEPMNTCEFQELPLSAKEMESIFGINHDNVPSLEISESTAYQAINDILRDPSVDKGRPVHISPRKIIAIRQYCSKARALMRNEGGDMMAFDLAVCQHILPQVRGHGVKFGKRLDELKGVLQDHALENAHAYLCQMIAYGQTDLHSYDFFCW